jgi:hypothetical protein
MGCGEGSTSFCEQKEAKKLFVYYGDTVLSSPPLPQGG